MPVLVVRRRLEIFLQEFSVQVAAATTPALGTAHHVVSPLDTSLSLECCEPSVAARCASTAVADPDIGLCYGSPLGRLVEGHEPGHTDTKILKLLDPVDLLAVARECCGGAGAGQ